MASVWTKVASVCVVIAAIFAFIANLATVLSWFGFERVPSPINTVTITNTPEVSIPSIDTPTPSPSSIPVTITDTPEVLIISTDTPIPSPSSIPVTITNTPEGSTPAPTITPALSAVPATELPLITPTSDSATGALPPSDVSALATWLVEVARRSLSPAEMCDTLQSADLLLPGETLVCVTSHDVTGDNRPEWMVVTSRANDGGNTLLLIDVVTGTVLHNSRDTLPANAVVTVRAVEDFTRDGVPDILYRVNSCATIITPCFFLWSGQSGLQSSNEVAFLRLLFSNDRFNSQEYTYAREIYEEIAFGTPTLQGSGWQHTPVEELLAVRRFAGARLIVTAFLQQGSDAGYFERFKSTFGNDDPYIIPLTAMVEAINRGDDRAAVCSAFRNAIVDINMTYPLNELGLGVEHICYFTN